MFEKLRLRHRSSTRPPQEKCFSTSRLVEPTGNLSQHGISPGFLGHVAEEALLGFTRDARAALPGTLGLVEREDHALPSGTHNGADVPFLAGFDFLFRILVDSEVQTAQSGDRGAANRVGRSGVETFLCALLSSRLHFR